VSGHVVHERDLIRTEGDPASRAYEANEWPASTSHPLLPVGN